MGVRYFIDLKNDGKISCEGDYYISSSFENLLFQCAVQKYEKNYYSNYLSIGYGGGSFTYDQRKSLDMILIVKIMPDWRARLKYEESEYYFIQKEVIEFMKTAIHIMKDSLNTDRFDIAYDIADMLHVLPDIIIQRNKKQLKRCWRSYWKVYVEPLYKKWKCDAFTKYKKFFILRSFIN